jgi:THO complex subunit 2
MDAHMAACLAAVKSFYIVNLAKKEQEKEGSSDNTPIFNANPYTSNVNDNQRLGLLAAILDDHNWPVAQWLLQALAPLLPASHPQVARALCNFARASISRVYASLQPSARPTGILQSGLEEVPPGVPPELVAEHFADLEKTLMPIMRSLSVYVYHDPVLVVRICRIMKAAYTAEPKAGAPKWVIELAEALVGALALLPQNAQIAWEIWEALSALEYRDRYLVYANVHWNAYTMHPEMLLVRARVQDEMRKLLKSMTKDNLAKKKRSLAKLSHANPLIVMETILDQVQKYESMIEVCRDAMAYSTTLTLDVFSFLALEELGGSLLLDNKEPMLQDDFANLARWLLNLCDFVSGVYVKYPRTELQGLLVHVLTRLQADSFGELEILRQLIHKMAGLEELGGALSQDMLMAKAGGEKLRHCIETPWPLDQLFAATEEAQIKSGGAAKFKAYQIMLKERKEASECLVAALESSGTSMALLVVLGQQISGCMHTKASQETMQVKFTSWLHKQCHQTLQVLQSLLCRRLPASAYVDRLPPLEKLVGKVEDGGLALDPEVPAFVIFDHDFVTCDFDHFMIPIPCDSCKIECLVFGEFLVSCYRCLYLIFPD